MTNEKITIHIEDKDVRELAPAYLGSRRDEMGAYQEALAKSDFDTLCGLGHKIKGSGGGFGFDRITEIGIELESAAKAQDLLGIERAIAKLTDFLARVIVVEGE